jgi:hypothetical protein
VIFGTCALTSSNISIRCRLPIKERISFSFCNFVDEPNTETAKFSVAWCAKIKQRSHKSKSSCFWGEVKGGSILSMHARKKRALAASLRHMNYFFTSPAMITDFQQLLKFSTCTFYIPFNMHICTSHCKPSHHIISHRLMPLQNKIHSFFLSDRNHRTGWRTPRSIQTVLCLSDHSFG